MSYFYTYPGMTRVWGVRRVLLDKSSNVKDSNVSKNYIVTKGNSMKIKTDDDNQVDDDNDVANDNDE